MEICPWQFLDLSLKEDEFELSDSVYGKRLREMSGGGLCDSDLDNEDIPLAKLRVTLRRISPDHSAEEEADPAIGKLEEFVRKQDTNTTQNQDPRMIYAVMTPVGSSAPGQPFALQQIGALIPVPEQSGSAICVPNSQFLGHSGTVAAARMNLSECISQGESNVAFDTFGNIKIQKGMDEGIHPAYQGVDPARKKRRRSEKSSLSSGLETSSVELPTGLEQVGKCPCCDDYFAFPCLLFDHLASSHPKMLQRAYCQICDHFFTSSSSLKYHNSKFHAETVDGDSVCWCKHCSTVRVHGSGKPFKAYCIACGERGFVNEECYKNHILMHLHEEVALNKKAKRCNNIPVPSKKKSETAEEKSENFEVAVLLSSFFRGKENGFFCKQCKQGFAFAAMLLLHVRNVHCLRWAR